MSRTLFPRRPWSRPRVEPLEPRLAPAVITVNTAEDELVLGGGLMSLREAILLANGTSASWAYQDLKSQVSDGWPATGQEDTIRFAIGSGPRTIQLKKPLPALTDPVVIDGTSQPGFAGKPILELDGSQTPPNTNGLILETSSSTLKGLVINGFRGDPAKATNGFGIVLKGGGGHRVETCYLGIDLAGMTAVGNTNGLGIFSPNNVVGGTTPPARNVISGNAGTGILVGGQSKPPGSTTWTTADAGGNVIQGNFIGTDFTGTVPVRNDWDGIALWQGAHDNIIGGSAPGARNVIAASGWEGVLIEGETTTRNIVQGNYVGTDVTGTVPLPNTIGVSIVDAPGNWVWKGNVLSGNLGNGVYIEGARASKNIVANNFIGTDPTGSLPVDNTASGVAILGAPENTVSGNTIANNAKRGVYIGKKDARGNTVTGNFIGTNAAGLPGLGNGWSGVEIDNAPNNTIGGSDEAHRNVICSNLQDGIRITGPDAQSNVITGNYVGVNPGGLVRLANHGSGILLAGASDTWVGGLTPAYGNVLSGNFGPGLTIRGASATGNTVWNNRIGTDKDGTGFVWGNLAEGVVILGGSKNAIGGIAQAPNMPVGNRIAGNALSGVRIEGPGAADNLVQGNVIGLDSSGQPMGNGGCGVLLTDAEQTTVGEKPDAASSKVSDTGAGNVITASALDGVRVVGSGAAGNVIRRNSIYGNTGLGINLKGGQENLRPANDGVTPNDADDADTGPNGLMNWPVGITAWYDAGANATYVSGLLATASPPDAVVDLYANKAVNPSGFGEGEFYLGSAVPAANGAFFLEVPGPLPADRPFLSGTATDNKGRGNTSEFSPVYGSPLVPGKVDIDEDGLPDEWELQGIDFDGNGSTDLDLPALNASPWRKDVFVEMDYMDGFMPRNGSLDLVKTAFARAPLLNLDGSPGIVLHVNRVEQANRIPYLNQVGFAPLPGPNNDFAELKETWFGSPADRGARRLAFHYCLFVHDQADDPGSSGMGDLHGDDFMVSLGTWSNPGASGGIEQLEAGTFMHELGHNLGLGHGGPMPPGQIGAIPGGPWTEQYKPNYLSVMNYSFQDRRHVNRPLDYSRFGPTFLTPLDETSLDEALGITLGNEIPGLAALGWDTTVSTVTLAGQRFFWAWKIWDPARKAWIDWDFNSSTSPPGASAFINDPTMAGQTQTTLTSLEDWTALRYNFRVGKINYAGGAGQDVGDGTDLTLPELTWQEALAQARTVDADGDGLVNPDDNAPFVANPDQADRDGDGVGDATQLLSLSLSDRRVPGGTTVTGTVTLLEPAPDGGLRVDLWTSDPDLLDLPRAVLVPAGSRTLAFAIGTSTRLTAYWPVTVYAATWGPSLASPLSVGPYQVPGSQSADFAVAVTASPDPAAAGEVLLYTITVTNLGPDTARPFLTSALSGDNNLLWTSPPSSFRANEIGFMNLDFLEPGTSTTVQVATVPTRPGVIHNRVRVEPNPFSRVVDPEPDNDTVDLATVVVSPPSRPTIVVTTAEDLVDDNPDRTSLREALALANARPGTDVITFAIPGPGPWTIRVTGILPNDTTQLPAITDPVVIDGTTQPGYAGTPVIGVLGDVENHLGQAGLTIAAGNSTVRGLALGGFDSAVALTAGGNNLVEGCYVGFDPATAEATSAWGNSTGIRVQGSTGNTLGGTTPAARNVLSGNGTAVLLGRGANGNTVLGNFIGLAPSGDRVLGNLIGVEVLESSGNRIGGTTPGARNVISGNLRYGIRLAGTSAGTPRDNRIEGNYLGPAANGSALATLVHGSLTARDDVTGAYYVFGPNDQGNGVGVGLFNAEGNTVGGADPGAGNVISGNTSNQGDLQSGTGIVIEGQSLVAGGPPPGADPANHVIGNRIGTAADGISPLGNSHTGIIVRESGQAVIGGLLPAEANVIAFNQLDGVVVSHTDGAVLKGNAIYANVVMGINHRFSVEAYAIVPNDPGDSDQYLSDDIQNFPVLTAVASTGGTTTIDGTIDTSPANQGRPLTLEFFASARLHPTGHGDAERFLGRATVTVQGVTPFHVVFPGEVPDGWWVTATATASGNTSEFAASLLVVSDADGDGATDAVEAASPNGGDANRDGSGDAGQAHVASLPHAFDWGWLTLEAAPGARLRGVQAAAPPPGAGAPAACPFGLLAFTLDAAAGAVTLTSSIPWSPDAVYGYGPTPGAPADHWYAFPSSGGTSAEILPDRVVLHLIDGGPADADGTANGRIVVRFAPAARSADRAPRPSLVVTTTDDVDDGVADPRHTSLREALRVANLVAGLDTIRFSIAPEVPHSYYQDDGVAGQVSLGRTALTTADDDAAIPDIDPDYPYSWWTIMPFWDHLPTITAPVVLDAYTQPGALPATDTTPARLRIALDLMMQDRHAGHVPDGLVVTGGGSTIRGLVIQCQGNDESIRNFFGSAIRLTQGSGNTIEGNFIGSDVSGTLGRGAKVGISIEQSTGNLIGGRTPAARNLVSANNYNLVLGTGADSNTITGNLIGPAVSGKDLLGDRQSYGAVPTYGVTISGNYNTIGGTTPSERNVISGNKDGYRNGYGLRIYGSGNVVQGNAIGTDVTGAGALGNGVGIEIFGPDNLVGGPAPGAGNVLSANDTWAVLVQGDRATGNRIQGNRIGTAADGRTPLPNGARNVVISAGPGNLVGGTEAGAGNVIAYSGDRPIPYGWLAAGTGVSIALGCAAAVLGNSIFANPTLGLDLGSPGVSPNVADEGADRQNFPLLSSAVTAGAVTTVAGTLRSTATTAFRIEFFASPVPDPSGYGEGERYLGAATVTTDGAGAAAFTVPLAPAVPVGQFLTATATRLDAQLRPTRTSEFSQAVDVGPGPEVALDYGDAPDPTYPTLAAQRGARHILVPGLFLGSGVSAEADGKPDPAAQGDDDDGVAFLSPLRQGQQASVRVSASAPGYLDAWVDFNRDGDWDDAGEQVFARTALAAGANTLAFTVPTSATPAAATFARFRLSSTGGLSPRYLAADGEVEDYAIPVLPHTLTARDDAATATMPNGVAIDVLANDTADGTTIDPRSVRIVSPPDDGAVTVDPVSGVITFVPAYRGTQKFTYEVSETAGAHATAAVTVTMPFTPYYPPYAREDAASTPEAAPVTVAVTANDWVSGTTLDLASLRIRAAPAHGLAVPGPGAGQVTYTPEPGFHGTDAFFYEIAGLTGDFAAARVTVSVTPVNHPPAARPDFATTRAGAPVTLDVAANDFDPDGTLDPGSVQVDEFPPGQEVAVDPATGALTWTPPEDFAGAVRLTYRIRDTAGASSAAAPVTVQVLPGHSPPQAHDDTLTLAVLAPAAIDVLANDTDPDGDLDPASLRLVAGAAVGTVVLNPAAGTFTYTPGPRFAGSDSWTYRVADLHGAASTATVLVRGPRPALPPGGFDAGGPDEGEVPAADLRGCVFLDGNADGVRQPAAEPALPGWNVFVDTDGNGLPGPGELSAVTGPDGAFRLAGLVPGMHRLRLACRPDHGAVPTGFASEGVTVTVAAGEPLPAPDLGLVPISQVSPVEIAAVIFPPSPDANTAFVHGLYRNLLGRDADPAGLAFWAGWLADGRTRAEVAAAVWASPEHHQLQVRHFYRTLLHRDPDPEGLAYHTRLFLEQGRSEDDVFRGIALSAEYQQRTATDAAFVAMLYDDALSREGEAAGLAYWEQAVHDRGRVQAARDFLATDESHLRMIDSYYAAFLHRPPEAGPGPGAARTGRQSWLDLVRAGKSPAWVGVGFLASPEYFINASSAL